jgi:putative serine protease PepD
MTEDERTSHAPAEPAPSVEPISTVTPQVPARDPEPLARRKKKRWHTAAVVTSGVVGGVLGGLLVTVILVWGFDLGGLGGGASETITIETDGEVSPAVAVAAKVVPSVVHVSVEGARFNPLTGMTTFTELGNGSGVILRHDGYIVTNNHVIEGADRVIVTIGMEELVAEVVGADTSTDLAVLKVDETGLPAAETGDTADLTVGQPVVAVGSPFGLDSSVTSGIISALSRSTLAFGVSDVAAYTNLIQTDAAINPGNSGGALADEEGVVIGVNTLIESPSGAVGAPQSAGIGFAIPIDFVVDVAEQLIANGCVVHPYLGVTTTSLDGATAARYGLSVDAGAVVQGVTEGSPAERAGLLRGDIIVRIGDAPVAGFGDVFTAVRSHDVGEAVAVVVVREAEEVELEAVLGADAECEE